MIQDHTPHTSDQPVGHDARLLSLVRLPILAGQLRGRYWLPASRGKLLRIYLGSYEREQTARFIRHIDPGGVVFDIGASAGYYTLLSSLLVGPQGRVIALEPAPSNATYLRHHVRLNRLANTTVYQAAVGATTGTAQFSPGQGTGTGRLAPHGSITVRTYRLDEVVDRQACKPTHLKIDVEGAELQVLQGATNTLRRYRPMIFLSTHGPGLHKSCCQVLKAWGYTLEPMVGHQLDRSPQILCRAA